MSALAVVAVVLLLLAAALAYLLATAVRRRRLPLVVHDPGPLPGGVRSLAGASDGVGLPGNAVEVLENGDGFFPSLLDDLRGAERSVNIAVYIWWDGRISAAVAEVLAEKARQGVEVRLLVDAFGSSRVFGRAAIRRETIARLREAGCRVRLYRPVRLSDLVRLDRRNHRKVAVVDGRIAHVFGHGIADVWGGDASGPGSWRDTGARLRGPAVAPVQAAFAGSWVEETGEVLAGDRFFPVLPAVGSATVHVASRLRPSSVSAVERLYRLAFAAARRELLIANPYLGAGPRTVGELADVARKGVDVRLLLPGRHTDAAVVRHAGHWLFRRLLEAGVRIFEYQPTFNHQKVVVVDRLWSHLGSANLDHRSFADNDELSLGILDGAVAETLAEAFERDLERAVEIEAGGWSRRGLAHRVWDRAAWTLRAWW